MISLRSLPKIELHRHLDCSMRLSTLIELAPRVGLELPKTLREIQEGFQILTPMLDLDSVLKKFLNAQKVLASEEILTRLAEETCEDAFQEGIRMIELRFAPTFITDGHPNLNPLKITQAFHRGIETAMKKWPIAAGLICIFQRNIDLETNRKILHFLLDHANLFCGADLADSEAAARPLAFQNLFREIQKKSIPITIHTGETPHAESVSWVRESVEYLGATRIGHGVQSIHSPALLEFLKKNRICLEVCPHSNYLTQAFPTYESHPLKKLYATGLRVTLNSDDPGMFGTNLTDEYFIAQSVHGFGPQEFTQMNQYGFEASFLPQKERWRKEFYP